MEYIGVFFINFLYISGRAFQQLNVMHNKRMWLVATSFVLAVAEVSLFGTIAFKAYETIESGELLAFAALIIPIWLGGSAGSLSAMEFHRRLRRD